MRDYSIFTDSSCDSPGDILSRHGVTRIPFYISFDQTRYYKEIEEMSIDLFYEKLSSEKIFPKTSLPSVQDYINAFTPVVEAGQDILCVCLSSKFSGSFQSAVNAKHIVEEDHENAVIEIVDSRQATSGQGLVVLQAAAMREAGISLRENVERLEQLRETCHIMFTVGTLEYLQKGGRIGKAASLAGSVLNLKPLIQMKHGELIPYGTIRGRKKSLDRIVTMTEEYFTTHGESYRDYDFLITTGLTVEEASKVKAATERLIGRPISYPIFQIGVTIGTNTGPDAIGICFIRRYDTADRR